MASDEPRHGAERLGDGVVKAGDPVAQMDLSQVVEEAAQTGG